MITINVSPSITCSISGFKIRSKEQMYLNSIYSKAYVQKEISQLKIIGFFFFY